MVLAHLPIALADLDHSHAGGQRIDLAIHRHAQQIGSQANQQIIRREYVADIFLVPVKTAHEGGMFGRKMGAVIDRLLIDRRAQHFRQLRRFHKRVRGDDLVPGDEHWAPSLTKPCRQIIQAGIGRPRRRIDPRTLAEMDRRFHIQNIAGQGNEHRPGGRCQRDLCCPTHDHRQVFNTGDLDRPFHQRRGDGHQRGVQQRLCQAVALFLLTGRDDQRRARKIGGIERAHGIAQARRHMHVDGRNFARGTGVTVGHGDNDGLLQAKNIRDIRLLGHGMHDGQFRGSGIAKQTRDAFVLQQSQKGAAACNGITLISVAHDKTPIPSRSKRWIRKQLCFFRGGDFTGRQFL